MEIDSQRPDVVPSDYVNPDWGSVRKVHDWRNYIPRWMQDNWDGFTEREKQLIAFMADEQAGAEEWD